MRRQNCLPSNLSIRGKLFDGKVTNSKQSKLSHYKVPSLPLVNLECLEVKAQFMRIFSVILIFESGTSINYQNADLSKSVSYVVVGFKHNGKTNGKRGRKFQSICNK